MSYFRRFVAYAPPPRADGLSFTKARIEEAAEAAGPWTAIAIIDLAPLDTDPTRPMARELSTSAATLEPGWYRVTWLDAAGSATSPTAPIRSVVEGADGIRPTIAEVAAKLRARTKVLGGNEVGTFDASTRPTADEVEALIDDALDEVLGKIKEPAAGTKYEGRARGLVALYAAMLIELSYFPEMVGTPKSPYDSYATLYDKRMKALIAEGETGEPQGEGGAGGDSPGNAAWTFPSGDLLGYGTRW